MVTYFGFMPTDIQVSMLEYQNTAGNIWGVCSGLKTFATPSYYALSFITPDDGYVVIAAFEMEKSGDEMLFSIFEGPTTWTGSTPVTVTGNMNRIINATKPNPFSFSDGLSNAGLTLAGGGEFCHTLMPGSAGGNILASSVATSGKIYVLKPSTRYAFKIEALGSATKMTFRAWFSHIIKE